MNQERTPHTEGLVAAKSRVSVNERLAKAKKQYDLFMYKHGRTIADLATDARQIGGAIEAGLILEGKPKAARAVTIFNLATDLIDGYAARKHEHGATPGGGWRDQQNDKKRSFMVGVADAEVGRVDWSDVVIRLGSDVFVNKWLRPHFAERGINVSAGWAGRASTTIGAIAELSATTERNPQIIQKIATGAKVARVGIYAVQWGRSLWKKNRENS